MSRQARPHAHIHAQTRTRERRHRLAHEAARLMAESGVRDYHQAKLKAAQRLGISDDASLPRNREIQAALREHQRLFQRDGGAALRERREAALHALEFFAGFQPRLVGAVLDGTADEHSPIALQLYSDDADAVARHLEQHGIPAETRERNLRLDRDRSGNFPVWLFSADALGFDLTVLPLAVLRQAPLSSVDGKPMRRASLAHVQQLLAEEEIRSHESRGSGLAAL